MANLFSKLINPGIDEEIKHLKSALAESVNEGDKKKSKRIMNKIIHVQLFRFQNSIQLWKTGIDNFENVQYPTNEELIRVYNDAVLDAHLTALMEARKRKTTGADFKIVDDNLDEIDDQTEKFKSQWFVDAMNYALDSIFYGYSLLQFGDQIGDDFDCVKVVPREFVYPQKEIVRNSPTSDTGIPWKKYAQWLIPAGNPDDMGLLAKAAPLTIYKKASMGSWADYTDLFGTPFRIGKTDVRDETTRDNMAEMFENMTSSTWAVVDKDDEVEFVQGKNVDAYQTFDAQVDRLNSEMSKLITGSTMTMDDGSSRSQSEVHENTTNLIVKSDAVFIENWVNKCLIPWLNFYHGFNITGKFMFDTTEVLTIKEQFEIDLELIKTGKYDIPADYITQTYGTPLDEVDDPDDDPDEPGGGNNSDANGTENSLPGKHQGETHGFDRFADEINAIYFDDCCHVHNDIDNPELNADIGQPLSDAEFEQLYNDIFNGEVTPDDLPVDLYNGTGELLSDGIVEGFENYQKLGLGFVPDQDFFDALRDNAFKFAGAKTYQQVLDMSNAIVDANGNQRTFSQFRREVDKINDVYNKNWLRAEYNNATSGSQMASIWNDNIQDIETFPFLKYLTTGDQRVRQSHVELNNIIKPVNDPFWDMYFPPNGWNCRCTTLKLSDDEDGVTDTANMNLNLPEDDFQFNVGKNRMLYSPEHPYFVMSKQGQKAVDALPLPAKRKM